MHIGIVALAAGALIVTGCKTTDTAAVADEREVHVSVHKHIMKGDHGDGERQIKIHIIRDGEEPIHIEGDSDSPEVKEALAKLEAEGIVVPDGSKHMMHSKGDHAAHMMKMDGDKQVWVMKMEGDGDSDAVMDIDVDVSEDGKTVTIRRGDTVETIVIPQGKDHMGMDHKTHFILKSEDGDGKEMSDHKVIVIEGESEEEIRKKLEELGLDIDIDVVFDELHEIEEETGE